MRYFDSGWNEWDGIPDDAKFLVRAVGTYHVQVISDALRENGFPYFTAASRKDDVSFYVQEDRFEEIKEAVRKSSLGKQYKDALNGDHPDERIS